MEVAFLLTTTQAIQNFFKESTDPVMIFRDGELLTANGSAHRLQQWLHFDPYYLLEVASTNFEQRHNPFDTCAQCTILGKMQAITVPVQLTNGTAHPLSYSLVYQELDHEKQLYSLVLKSRGIADRATQLARQRELNRYVNQAHEEERKRISQDLHDSIAQGVYSAIMGVRRIKQQEMPPAELRRVAEVIETQLETTLHEVKEMALNIRPTVLDSFGLEAAIRALAKRLTENSGVPITLVAHVTGKLTTAVQTVLYRITQESINNALKHANPSEITIVLVSHQHFINLEVIDDGDGFDPKTHSQFNGHSLGLMNMSERVKALNGFFDLQSSPGAGTTVTVKFPAHQPSKESQR